MNENSINRVELQGRVGTVRIQSAAGCVVALFSLMTDEIYKASDGTERGYMEVMASSLKVLE